MKTKTVKITDSVKQILKDSCIENEGTLLHISSQLNRDEYTEVNKVLVALGGKWNRKLNGHLFPIDIREYLSDGIKNGAVVDKKKSYEFFYTPLSVIENMLSIALIDDEDTFTVLEPSAGEGHIVDELRKSCSRTNIICNELDIQRYNILKEKGYQCTNKDFMSLEPFDVDYVLMNPPFSEEVDHIMHAYKFLKPGGGMVTIASSTILNKSNSKNREFAEWFKSIEGVVIKLGINAFKEAGTSVSTIILYLTKSEA